MPDEQAKVVREIPRDAETIELFKRFAGPILALEITGSFRIDLATSGRAELGSLLVLQNQFV